MIGQKQTDIAVLNRRVTLSAYDSIQDVVYGGNQLVLKETFDTWAQVVQKGGSTGINQGQMKSDFTYVITIRFRPQVSENWNITYEGQTLIINQLQVDDPGYKRYLIIYCSVSEQQQSWS